MKKIEITKEEWERLTRVNEQRKAIKRAYNKRRTTRIYLLAQKAIQLGVKVTDEEIDNWMGVRQTFDF